MGKIASFLFDFVIAIGIIFFSVLLYFGLRMESVIKTIDNEITEEFLSEVKETGVLTPYNYESFLEKLSFTNVLYDISFEHRYKVTEPEYRMRTLEEILAAQKAAYTGENIYHYREVATQKPAVTDPIDNSGLTMNTETNESILAKSSNTPSVGHSHTEACYNGGHKHESVYGHNLKNVPVYYRYFYEAHYNGNYGYKLDVMCTGCDKEIYSIEYIGGDNGSYMEGYISNYSYNSDGYRNTSRNRFVLYPSDSVYTSCINMIQGMKNASDAMQYGTEKRRCSLSLVYPYSGMITSNGAGGLALIPFTGCQYIEGHPNRTCLPVGNVADPVNIYYYHRYDPDLDGGDTYYLKITCAKCSRDILEMNGYLGNGGGYLYAGRRSLSISVWEYDGHGGIRKQDYIATGSILSPFFLETISAINNHVMGLSGLVETNNSLVNDRLYEVNGTNIRWNMLTIPYIRSAYWETYGSRVSGEGTSLESRIPGLIQGTFQYGGCPYCSPFGKYYACGKSSVIQCDKLLASITPTHPVQSVYIGEALITTVKATYLDGSTRVVIAGTDFHTDTPIRNKSVVLSYSDTLGNVKTCTITVNVIPKTKTCINGHSYNLRNNGSDPGCPFCKAYVSSIRVINPSTPSMTIIIGTTLQQNGVKLLVSYYDGHTETITDGYEDNLDRQYLGTKPVTIGYKGASTQLQVTTVCAKMTCERCGYIYELYPDGTNPGCPRCLSKTPVFTGNIFEYEEVNYTNEILEELYKEGEYALHTNDNIQIRIRSKSYSLARKLLQLIYPYMADKKWLTLNKSEAVKAK
jgi:hypothetical protein